MLIHDLEYQQPDPDGGGFRLSAMAAALGVAALFGALYGELQALLS